MEILRFVRCESFPEGARLVGCIGEEEEAIIWVIPSTNAPPIAMRMTATEALLVQQRYTRQQEELTETNAKAKRGETVDESVVRTIINRDIFEEITAKIVEA